MSQTKKEHGILFCGPMVRAILEGRKTQTRRVIVPQPFPTRNGWYHYDHPGGGSSHWHADTWQREEGTAPLECWCPYGGPGDLLWICETWAAGEEWDDTRPRDIDPLSGGADIWYLADGAKPPLYGKTRPSIFMPKWAAHTWLEISEVRAQRVQDADSDDLLAEGMEDCSTCYGWGYRESGGEIIDCPQCKGVANYLEDQFRALWNCLNARRGYGWDKNPWVFTITFKRMERSTSCQ